MLEGAEESRLVAPVADWHWLCAVVVVVAVVVVEGVINEKVVMLVAHWRWLWRWGLWW